MNTSNYGTSTSFEDAIPISKGDWGEMALKELAKEPTEPANSDVVVLGYRALSNKNRKAYYKAAKLRLISVLEHMRTTWPTLTTPMYICYGAGTSVVSVDEYTPAECLEGHMDVFANDIRIHGARCWVCGVINYGRSYSLVVDGATKPKASPLAFLDDRLQFGRYQGGLHTRCMKGLLCTRCQLTPTTNDDAISVMKTGAWCEVCYKNLLCNITPIEFTSESRRQAAKRLAVLPR